MEPTKTYPAGHAKLPTVTPAELARASQLFKWGLQEMRTLTQRVDDLDKTVKQMARDGVHRDAWKQIEHDVAKLRDDVRRIQAVGE